MLRGTAGGSVGTLGLRDPKALGKETALQVAPGRVLRRKARYTLVLQELEGSLAGQLDSQPCTTGGSFSWCLEQGL